MESIRPYFGLTGNYFVKNNASIFLQTKTVFDKIKSK